MRPRPPAGDPAASPPAGTARAAALRLLGRRDYTVAELTARLAARGFAPAAVADAVASLVADGSADDARAARAHVRMARELKGRGRVRIARELQARGISPDLAASVLAGDSDEDERAALDRVLARKALPSRLTMADRRRLFQHLLRRGFPADLVADALRRRS